MRNPKREIQRARKKMDKEKKLETCPTCGAYMRTGIPVQHDGMRIMFQWKGGVVDQRFTFDPRLRQESEGDLPKIFRYIHQVLGMWEEWFQQQFKERYKHPKILVPGASRIIKGSLNIDTGRKP